MSKCTICDIEINGENAPLLAMGAVGNPKLLCEECAALLDTATLGRDYDEIEAAMDRLGQKMGNGNPDRVTYNIVSGLMAKAAGRAKAIKLGKYDFSKDEVEELPDEDELEEIPEELLETEEDRELDKLDEEKMAKFDKVYNIILTIAIIGFVAALVWKLVDAFLL